MAVVAAFEHQPISLVGEDVPFREVHLRQLERLNRQAGVDLIKLGYKQLRATSFVGVIQLGNVTLQVLPKVDATGRDDANSPTSVDSAVANLLWMLVYAGELPIHENEVASLLKRRGNLFEILVRIFCERLAEQLERGFYRTYQHREDTLPVLRGRWLLGQQLRRQPLLRDRFLVSYDEFVEDNPLNRVFCHTIHRLWGLTRNAGNRKRLDILRMWFDQVTLLPHVSAQDLAKVTFTRLNAAYRPAFNLACMFLTQESLQLQTGRTQAFTFLFDMNVLFERFVAGFLRRHRLQALPENLRSCEILAQGAGDPRWLAQTQPKGGRGRFRLRPDLLLRRSDRSIAMVVDTKYKTRAAIQEADAYQMHAYAARYECPDVLLLYPESQMPSQTLYIDNPIGESPICLRARTIGLRYDMRSRHGQEELASELALALAGE
jgi:5-methylcytosine-specific restriction enzyme subunit McrC